MSSKTLILPQSTSKNALSPLSSNLPPLFKKRPPLIDIVLDSQIDKLPKEVFYCSKCVNPNQRPRLQFDENRVCAACNYAYEKDHLIDWKKREDELLGLLDKYRSKDGSYDAIVPSSGGKDSGYVAHNLKYVYGMHPLSITWTPHQYTAHGWKNLQALIDSGFDSILYRPNGILHRKISRLAFELLGDHYEGWSYGANAYPLHMAIKMGIPLVFYGENQPVEYGGNIADKNRFEDDYSDRVHIQYKGTRGIDTLIEKGLEYGYFTEEEIKENTAALKYYKVPPLQELQQAGVRCIFLGYFKKWGPSTSNHYCQKNTGFRPNPDGRSPATYIDYHSLDDATDAFHFYMQFIKFTFGGCTSDASIEIRNGLITREKAVEMVKKYDSEFPPRPYFENFLNYMDLTEDEFWQTVEKFRTPQLWEKKDGTWKQKYQVE